MVGAKQFYTGRYEPEMMIKLILTEGVTYSHCVPTILQMILASPATKSLDFSNWAVLIGGAPLSKGLARAAQAVGIEIVSAYGMSETCPGICVARPKDHMAAAAGRGVLPKYAVPDKYVIVEEIPKTSVGKVNKKKFREIYA